MKEGWKYKKLGEICRVINGRAYSKDEMLNQGKYRLLRVGNFFTNDSWYYSDLELEEDKYCDNGDLLYAWSASFGPRIWNGEKVIYHYHIWKMVCSEEIDKFFLCYWLDSDELKKQTMTNLHGATMAHITKRIIENAIVSYPSLSEQQSIVDYLDSAFAKIDAMKANAEKALNEAKALFQASLKEMLEPKEGWVTSTLKDECFKITDGTHQTPKYFQTGYIFLSSKNVTTRKIDWINVKFIDESQHQIMHKRVAPKVGDILLAKNGTTGVAAMVDRDVVFDIYVSLALLRSKGNVTSDYLLAFVNSPIAKEQFDKRLIGMGVPNLHLGEINKVVITYPIDKEEQAKVTKKIKELDYQIIRLQANYEKISQECDALKQAILRQVFE